MPYTSPYKTTWIIQTNGGVQHPQNARRLIEECSELGLKHLDIVVNKNIPDAMYEVEKPFVVYGLDTIVKQSHLDPRLNSGVFYDPQIFTYKNALDHYGNAMLNADAEILTYGEFLAQDYLYEQEFFIRTNADSKTISARKIRFGDEVDKYNHLEIPQLVKNIDVVVSSPKNVWFEYRFFVVDGDIIASSQYLPCSSPTIPDNATEFAKKTVYAYTPHDVFVLDIGFSITHNEYKIIELNAFNWCSFYHCSVRQIAQAVSIYAERR
jgi:hypothetical protein